MLNVVPLSELVEDKQSVQNVAANTAQPFEPEAWFTNQGTGHRLHHSSYIGMAKQFATPKDAENWIEQRNLNKRFCVDCTVERAA